MPLQRRKKAENLAVSDGLTEACQQFDISSEGIITAISSTPIGSFEGDLLTTPGLVDIQVNGFAGIDFNNLSLTPDQFDFALEALLASGITKVLPTLISAPLAILSQRLSNLDKAVCESKLGRLMVAGYHLEGPFLSPTEGFRGCHPKEAMIPASIAVFDHLQEVATLPIVIVTVAPERPHALNFIKTMSKRGIVCALGQSLKRWRPGLFWQLT